MAKTMKRMAALWLFWMLWATLAAIVSPAANAASLLPPGKNCFQDANGASLKSGTVGFFIVNTTTPKNTWQDSTQTATNANPLTLDTSGCALIYGSGSYREQVKDSLGNLIWDQVVSSPSIAGVSWGGTSTGSANAQVVTASEFYGIDGQVVAFLAGYTNSGATTLTTQNVAAAAVVEDTTSGPVALSGNEIIAGNVIEVIYSSADGHFHIVNPLSASGATTDYQAFLTSGTWTKPSGVTSNSQTHIQCWGSGGGGGANATGGGGGGGGYSDRWISTSSLGANESVTVGAGGAISGAGNNSTFGAWLTAYGGGLGQNGAGGGGGGGGGESAAGSAGAGSAGGAGGGPWLVAGGLSTPTAGTASPSGGGGGGGTGATAGAGGAGYFGGGGGGGGTATAASTGGAGGSSVWGGGGGAGMGASTSGAAGASKFGGAGGTNGVAGTQPGGGGGRNAAGGAGQCQVTTFI
jgi:hypothetical protein